MALSPFIFLVSVITSYLQIFFIFLNCLWALTLQCLATTYLNFSLYELDLSGHPICGSPFRACLQLYHGLGDSNNRGLEAGMSVMKAEAWWALCSWCAPAHTLGLSSYARVQRVRTQVLSSVLTEASMSLCCSSTTLQSPSCRPIMWEVRISRRHKHLVLNIMQAGSHSKWPLVSCSFHLEWCLQSTFMLPHSRMSISEGWGVPGMEESGSDGRSEGCSPN